MFKTLLVVLEKQPTQCIHILGTRTHRVDLRCQLTLREIEGCRYSVLRLRFLFPWYVRGGGGLLLVYMPFL
jgi:hypothetical protein